MFLFPPIHFLKFLVKSQPQRSYKKGSYKKRVYTVEPRFNEALRDWEIGSLKRGFVISRFVFHIFYCD